MSTTFFQILFWFTMSLSPEQVVQKQLDSYNSRDIEAFMSVMHPEVMLLNHADGQVLAEGYEQVESIYTDLFENSPQLHSSLKNRMVMGNKVIDHESITGRQGNAKAIELIVIYEVAEEKIKKITVIRP